MAAGALERAMEQSEGAITPDEAAQILHASAKLGVGPGERLAKRARAVISHSERPFAISQALWAVGKSGDMGSKRALSSLLIEAKRLAQSMKAIDAANTACASAYLGDGTALPELIDRVVDLAKMGQASPQAMSNCLWAAGRLGKSECKQPCHRLALSFSECESLGSSIEASTGAWGAAKVGVDSQAVGALCRLVCDDQKRKGSQQKPIAVALAACGICGARSAAYALIDCADFSRMAPDDLANALWGGAKCKASFTSERMEAAKSSVEGTVGDMSPSALVHTAFAASRMGMERGVLSEVVADAIASRADAFSSSQLTAILRSFVEGGEPPEGTQMEPLLKRARLLAENGEIGPIDSAMMLASLSRLPCFPRPSLLNSLAETVRQGVNRLGASQVSSAVSLSLPTLTPKAASSLLHALEEKVDGASARQAALCLAALGEAEREIGALGRGNLAEKLAEAVRQSPWELSVNDCALFVQALERLGVEMLADDLELLLTGSITGDDESASLAVSFRLAE